MNKYRRIEVNAFRRRVTIISGEWPSAAGVPYSADDTVSLNDANLCEQLEPTSPEGQEILVEAVRSLERRLSPEALETIRSGRTIIIPRESKPNGFHLRLQSLYRLICPVVFRLVRKEK